MVFTDGGSWGLRFKRTRLPGGRPRLGLRPSNCNLWWFIVSLCSLWKAPRFQGGAIITKTPLHASSATQFPRVFWTMPTVERSYLYPPSWPEVNLPARTYGLKKSFRVCFNKAGDQPEEWSPSELHLVSLGRNFTGFPAWQNPGGRMCRKAQGPQSLQVRSPASLSPLLASLSKWTLDLKFCWGGKWNTLLRDPQRWQLVFLGDEEYFILSREEKNS